MKRLIKTLAFMLAGALSVLIVASCGPERQGRRGGMSEESPVTFHKGDDPEIVKASEEARKTFKYFWKQVSYDFNRIVPALEVACIKVPFSDDESDPDAQVEYMWVSDIDYDGVVIGGTLINAPNWLKSVKEGDPIECKVSEISDWMYVLSGKVYGGYTTQVTRRRMSAAERQSYDEAWGLEFPPPDEVLVPPETSEFELTLASKLKEHLEKNPEDIGTLDDQGRNLLHLMALYGRPDSVRVLLNAGLDPLQKCPQGRTPMDYASFLGWGNVVEILKNAEAERAGALDAPSSRQ